MVLFRLEDLFLLLTCRLFVPACLLALLLFGPAGASGGTETVLVVHPENAVSSLTRQEAANIFLGKKSHWGEEEGRIEVHVQKDESLNREFLPGLVSKSPRQFFLYWKRVVFSGTGLPPLQVEDDRQMVEAVAANPRAIGYIRKESLDPSVRPVQLR